MKQSKDTEAGEAREAREEPQEVGSKRLKPSSRIDIKKYKEMIENMRNNY
jgi:hypothetical protein